MPCGGRCSASSATWSHPDVLVRLDPGDALLCFTDGVTEGRGPAVMFGDGRAGRGARELRRPRRGRDRRARDAGRARLPGRPHAGRSRPARPPRAAFLESAVAWQDADWRASSVCWGPTRCSRPPTGTSDRRSTTRSASSPSLALGLTPVVFIITGALFFCTAATYAEATAMYPEAGGSSSFARHAFNEFWSFFAAWAQMLNYVATIAISAFFVPHYLGGLFWEPLRSVAGRHRRRQRRDRAAGGDQRARRQGVDRRQHPARGHRLRQPAAARARRRLPRPRRRRRWSTTSASAPRRSGPTSCSRSRSACSPTRASRRSRTWRRRPRTRRRRSRPRSTA